VYPGPHTMKHTILLAESAVHNNRAPIAEEIDPDAFGKIRSLVQKASSNGKSLRQIATVLASMNASSQDEIEETVVPYIKSGLKGVFAAFMPLGDVMNAYESGMTPSKAAPSNK